MTTITSQAGTLTIKTDERYISIDEDSIYGAFLTSTSVKSIYFHKFSNSTFASVVFQNETKYHYYGVPHSVILEVFGSDSIGKAFNELIKKGGYTYKKVEQ
jgi:hypothetical protein